VPSLDSTNQTLEEYRQYLETLAFIQVPPRLRSKFGRSEIISQTLLEAYQCLDRIRDMDEEGRKRWLRRMFINNLLDEIRKYPAEDEVALDLERWRASDEPSPSKQAATNEEALRLLEAISRLPERQREALILQQYHGWKLKEIARHMNCTINAVAGLHANGLRNLKKLLPPRE
jgi:RNA polymerase sigma factor (sigma-70 family)